MQSHSDRNSNRWLIAVVAGALMLVLLLGGLGTVLALLWLTPVQVSSSTATPEQAVAVVQPREEQAPDSAGAQIRISEQRVMVEFPEKLTFSADIAVATTATIEQVILEYGVDKLTCGDVTAKAFPTFAPGNSASVNWTWEMRQSGSEPPGATIWYRWRVYDSSGNEHVSEEQHVTWLDDNHDWQQVTRGQVTLHWYDGPSRFAEALLDSADQALTQLGETTGVIPEAPINLYIYGSTTDMRDAVLYEPGWTGGQAFPEHDIVIIGVSPDNLDWGMRTVAHELTHILVGHRTFSCLGNVPTWLNEGIAVYGEGGPEQSSQAQLDDAIAANRMISVRALSGSFSEHPDRADLSYAQSYSLVNFLISEFGKAKLLALFDALGQGTESDDALYEVYGFGLDGLDDRWRAAVGAPPRVADSAAPTATPVPTPVPTIRPASS